MRFVYLEGDVAPRGEGFYSVGPDGTLEKGGPYTVTDVLDLRRAMIAVWNFEANLLVATDDHDQLRVLLQDAWGDWSPEFADRVATGDELRIIGAAVPEEPVVGIRGP